MNTNLQINMFQSLILLWMLSTSQGLALDWTSFVPHVSPESGEPPCAHGHNYCLKVKDYPTDTIVKLLKSAPREITSYLHNSLDAKTHSPNMEFQVNLHTNTSSMKKKDEQLCRSYIRIIRPLVARDDGNQWRYIVNVGEHEQLLEIETSTKQENAARNTQNKLRLYASRRWWRGGCSLLTLLAAG
ncbi:neurotrophin 1-like isoform X2 [Plodia interpunctella]|uniref:neurotrophin 1-like isoform X2 n=1 Tax=Plodia interpunctella TaxID=58824 RepID=UPI00236784A8|nr:neurotrophin 1-like isoform X2 [Plodia interpunctella]